MRPRRIGSPSTACAAGIDPARLRMAGSWLGTSGRTCTTTKMAAGRFAGRPPTSFNSGSNPPLDASDERIDGQAVAADGTFPGLAPTSVATHGGRLPVVIVPGEAVVVTLHGHAD